MKMALPESIELNGTTYATAELSDTARQQVTNIQIVDADIIRLQQRLAIAKTARNAYVSALATLIAQRQ